MAKRELLIAVGFLVAGALAYWLTAAPRERPIPRNTLPALVEEWRQETARSASRETVRTSGNRPLGREVAEVRLSGFTRVDVVGEDRADVAWTLVVAASGPTPDAARTSAANTTLVEDDLGAALALSPTSAGGDTRRTAELTVRVPAHVSLRLEGARRVTVDGTSGVRLEGIVGDVSLKNVRGPLTGAHRNGALDVAGARTLNLNLNASRATLAGVEGDITISARNGECHLVAPAGATTIEATGVVLTATESTGSLRANITNGSMTITSPRDLVHVDARRARIDLSLDRPVPITVVGVESTTAAALGETLPITVDATITNGTIDARGVGLTATPTHDGARLVHTFGAAARVTLRATRGAIEITRRK